MIKVKLTRVTENPILAIEEAASNCYDSKPSKSGRIMKACYKNGHHSVLEFADFTFQQMEELQGQPHGGDLRRACCCGTYRGGCDNRFDEPFQEGRSSPR